MWICPFCQENLVISEAGNAWSCENNHLFDCAREGYVNLLPSNKKSSVEPGDNAQMIAARRRIHTAGIYSPLAAAIQSQLAGLEFNTRILDIGCGEGYYSNAVQQALPEAQVYAVDIAKPAIKLAAKNYPAVNFAVATNFSLPLPAASQDALLRVFAPGDDEEVRRVLRGEGAYLEVTPAARHLWVLREALYETPRPHAAARQEISKMKLQDSSTVEFEVELDQPLLRDLVAMTPFAHRGRREKREELLQLDGLSVQMAFTLNLFKKKTHNPWGVALED
jgi:23S rRNA (guanine745-N1)-methyltransferase